MRLGVSGSSLKFYASSVFKRGAPPGQADKLRSLAPIFYCCGVSMPHVGYVHKTGYSMSLIHGWDAISYLHDHTPEECFRFFDLAVDCVRDMLKLSPYQEVPIGVFEKKIYQVLGKTGYTPIGVRAAAAILRRLRKQRPIRLPIGICHGDFTLSNLMVARDGRVYCFDPIPVFVESPFLDAVKLLQDGWHGWTAHIYAGPVDRARMRFMMDALTDRVDSLKLDPFLLHDLGGINMLRVLPYVRGTETFKFVEKELEKYV